MDEEMEKRQNDKRRRKEAKTEKAMKQLRKQTIKPRWLKGSAVSECLHRQTVRPTSYNDN